MSKVNAVIDVLKQKDSAGGYDDDKRVKVNIEPQKLGYIELVTVRQIWKHSDPQ